MLQQIEEQLRLGKKKFVFDGRAEDFLSFIIIKIHQLVRLLKGKVNPADIYYLSGADKCEQDYEGLAKTHGWEDRIQLICFQHFRYYANKYVAELPHVDYTVSAKEKKFLCFNKISRSHRTILLEHMLRKNLVKDSFYSFFSFGADYIDWYRNIDNLNDNFYSIKKHKNVFPLKLNITEERHNPADTRLNDFVYTENSYFSIVTETVFNTTHSGWLWDGGTVGASIFFSEKIFKPMLMKHPFILVGRPNSLKTLREYGFKTFSPYIDESYDSIQDDRHRMETLVEEIDRLCSLDSEEWIELQTRLKEILDHNYEWLKSDSTFISREDINKLLD